MGQHKCGIYAIQHIATGLFYIGSSTRIAKRWYEHRRQLNGGNHHAIYLQHSWNKYGPDGFTFFVLEECSPNDLLAKEQEYIDAFHPVFNYCPTAGSKLGYRMSEEQRAEFKRVMRQRASERVTRCRKGHNYTPENTYIDPDGARRCRSCQYEANRAITERTRKFTRDQEACRRGHPWTPENTAYQNGARLCRACSSERKRRQYHKDPERSRAVKRADHQKHREKRLMYLTNYRAARRARATD